MTSHSGENDQPPLANPSCAILEGGRIERLLFPLLLLGPVVHAAALILQHRLPKGHDTFDLFTIQWYFLSNAAGSGEVAQWVPYLTHGMIATYWYWMQASLLQNVLLPAGTLLRGLDVLPVFYLTLLVEELLLAVGCWLLARRLFGSRAVAFFVGVTVLGTSVWMDQVSTFLFIYAIPLILYFGHRLLDSGRWHFLLLAGNLLAFQTIGSVPYFIPVTSLTVVVYFGSLFLLDGGETRKKLRGLRWSWGAAASLAFVVFSFWSAYRYLTIGPDMIANYIPGRNLDGTVSLETFLVYGGEPGLRRWVELVTRLSPWLDNSRYAGMLSVPLILAGVARAGRRRVHLPATALVLLLFSLGGVVSVVLYHIWPLMNYYRHLVMVSAVVRLFLCFIAGAGFQWLFLDGPSRGRRGTAALLATAMLATAFGLHALAQRGDPGRPLYALLKNESARFPGHMLNNSEIRRRLEIAATLALLSCLVLGAAWRSGSPRGRRAVAVAALLLAAADVWQFKFAVSFNRSEIVPLPVRDLTRTAPFPYRPTRSPGRLESGDRMKALSSFHKFAGASYWNIDMFALEDRFETNFRTDFWLRPFDKLLRTSGGQPLRGKGTRTRGAQPFGPLRVSDKVRMLRRFGGLTLSKLQLFTNAYALASESEVSDVMRLSSYKGDLLFLQADAAAAAAVGLQSWTQQRPLDASDRVDLRFEVYQYDANNLVVEVENPGSDRAWLFYADTWHPFWRATVNGAAAPLLRAAMAYKAVPVGPGRSRVHFRFGSRERAAWTGWFTVQSCFWLAMLATLLACEIASARPRPVSHGA